MWGGGFTKGMLYQHIYTFLYMVSEIPSHMFKKYKKIKGLRKNYLTKMS